jgi:phosphoglycolate phosphatase-like HAD superfamily hydrolase
VDETILSEIRCAVFDVGETLVDESRMWADLAHQAGVTPFTLCGLVGALIQRGEDHRGVWDVIGVSSPVRRLKIERSDIYPDAVGCLAAARRAGLAVGVAGNQPQGVENLLRNAGLESDFVASSAAWGVAKPDRQFFVRVIQQAQVPAHTILYVGDRLDNDVLPAREAGMRTVFLRRGPWGFLHAHWPQVELADLRVDSLHELAELFRGHQAAP